MAMRSHVFNQQGTVGGVDGEGVDAGAQYSLGKILAIWALAALPMALLAWVVAPAVIRSSPLHPGVVYWLLTIAGMAWQAVVGLAILYRELGTLRWSAVRKRTWLQTPRDPESGRPERKLYWWLVPALLFAALINMALAGVIDAPMARLFPGLQPAAY